MNDKPLKQQILRGLAEQGVPADYNPWDAVQKRLEGRLASRWAGRILARRRLVFAGLVTLLVLAAGLALAATPQGRVAAQGLLHLFTRAESNRLPVPEDQPVEPIPPTRTPVPTRRVELQTNSPSQEPAETQRAMPQPTRDDGEVASGLSIEEAERLAGFDVLVPGSLPPGYQRTEVSYQRATGAVTQIFAYRPVQAGERFVLTQQPSLPEDSIGSSAAIETFTVGGVPVEMVSGSWFVAAGSRTEEWIADAPVHTARWQAGGQTFTLRFMVGDTFSPAYLSPEDRLAMLEVILGARAKFPERLDLNHLTSFEEVEQAAGFKPAAPSILPEGYRFDHATYEPENRRLILVYRLEGSSGMGNLVLFEFPKPVSQPLVGGDETSLPPRAIETVAVGGAEGRLVQGAVVDDVYDADFGWSLTWETDTLRISLRFHNSDRSAVRLDRAQMLAIAESVR